MMIKTAVAALAGLALAAPAAIASTAASAAPRTVQAAASAVLLAAGDIPSCINGKPAPNAFATAAILGANAGTVAPVGDLDNDGGAAANYPKCYGPTWGKYKSRSKPTPGNHDYNTAGAAGYFAYWGATAGQPGKGYYSYDLGAWHVVVLNGNCSKISGGCAAGGAQEKWLRADLAAHPAMCTLAYWHQALFTSSSVHPGTTSVRPLWQALYDFGAEIVLNGHNHQYERFAPQTPTGASSPTRGIREFEVGTGGKSHYSFGTIRPNSQVRNGTTYGVLKLTLDPTSYSWKFLPVAGKTFTDSGTTACHQ
jgi:hypothetical protein